MVNISKVMLTIPTEIPENYLSDIDSSYSTTEALTTSITETSNSENDITCTETDPLIPIQEPATTPMPVIELINNDIEPEVAIVESSLQESTTEETVTNITSTEETVTEVTTTNLVAEVTTTDAVTEVTTADTVPEVPTENVINDQEFTSTETIISIPILTEPDIPAVSAVPIKRSLSLDEINMFKATSVETTTEAQLEMSTSTISPLEDPEEKIEEFSTNLLTSSQPNSVVEVQHSTPVPASSIAPAVSEDDLFLDNWANHISENVDDHYDPIDSSLDLNLDSSLFQNEDTEIVPEVIVEATTLKNEPNEITTISTNQATTESENLSNIPYSDTEESYPAIFSPQNLLNLFSFDHQPSSSNLKATWWPKSRSSSMADLAESSVKKQRKRDNKISLNDDSEENSGNQRMFGRRFNRKFKNSVGILEKLFGNYFLQ
ncbi:uncharacterized protein LOC129910601 isoform X2 [Episyrphus balteatus]|uniref:uncharacterized protein LOC129910601 isoform X2 n=1 Tax=Episyrphus balteatus TaxID=286459 RepID=UPI0024865667|nr:uncharacterized protein LOC129910601 isoform X2 [Episyrphus balteatus]